MTSQPAPANDRIVAERMRLVREMLARVRRVAGSTGTCKIFPPANGVRCARGADWPPAVRASTNHDH